jgi:hypothetical protein
MANLFLKRDFPELDTERIAPHRSRGIATVLYIITHGLWLLTSFAGLVFAITDALPQGRQVLLVAKILE